MEELFTHPEFYGLLLEDDELHVVHNGTEKVQTIAMPDFLSNIPNLYGMFCMDSGKYKGKWGIWKWNDLGNVEPVKLADTWQEIVG